MTIRRRKRPTSLSQFRARQQFGTGPSRQAEQTRQRRAADVVAKLERARCDERDGYCRLWHRPGFFCAGASDWAHLPAWRRSKTRGRPAVERHVGVTIKLCRYHHDLLDTHFLRIDGTAANADGPMRFRLGRVVYDERLFTTTALVPTLWVLHGHRWVNTNLRPDEPKRLGKAER